MNKNNIFNITFVDAHHVYEFIQNHQNFIILLFLHVVVDGYKCEKGEKKKF